MPSAPPPDGAGRGGRRGRVRKHRRGTARRPLPPREPRARALRTLDVLINNADIGPNAPFDAPKVDEWEQMIDINIKGVLYGIAAALPVFRRQGYGHVVNTASTRAFSSGRTCRLRRHEIRGALHLRRPAPRSRRQPARNGRLPGVRPHRLRRHVDQRRPVSPLDQGTRPDGHPACRDRLRDRATRQHRYRRDRRAPHRPGVRWSTRWPRA